ncbi:MAG: hypothetical protein ACLP50_36645 [Solirubrobacteraceae bacterium]
MNLVLARVIGLLAAAVLLLALVVGDAAAKPLVPDNPLGAHSMLYSDTPLAFKAQMFSQAAAMDVSEIRVDLDLSAVYSSPGAAPDFSTVDQYMSLAAAYHLRVLANITTMPWWLADCQTPAEAAAASYECGTNEPVAYAQLVGAIAAHAKGYVDDYELINEPDGSWAWSGTPRQYAWMLSDVYQAVHQADPGARVMFGGLMANDGWIQQVFATPGANAAHSFDIANVHIRALMPQLAPDLASWRKLFARYGFDGLIWVTEHGYPSDPAYQYDPSYRGTTPQNGLDEQAAYLRASVPTLITAGAAKVFITERDNLGGAFASEGVVSGQVSDPIADQPSYTIVRKPAFYALKALSSQLASQPLTRSSKSSRSPLPIRRQSPCARSSSRSSQTRCAHHNHPRCIGRRSALEIVHNMITGLPIDLTDSLRSSRPTRREFTSSTG